MKQSNLSLKNNKEQVKKHRKVRKDAGLREIKIWICKSDVSKVNKALSPFLHKANKVLKQFREQK